MCIRKKIISTLSVVAILVTMLSVAAFSTASAESFVQSFENGGTTTTYAAGNSITAVSTDVAHTGSQSLKMVMDKDYGNQTANRVVYETDQGQVKFAFGTKVVVSFWLYTEDEFVCKPRLIMDPNFSTMDTWVRDKGFDLDEVTLPTGEWVQVTKMVTLAQPSDYSDYEDTYLSAGVVVANALPEGVSSYTMYMDDVSIKEYVPTPGVQSFEEGATKLFAAKASTTTISTDRAHSGVSAVKMVIDKDYGSSETNRVVYEEDGVPVQLAFGKMYEVTFWIYSEQTFLGKPRLVFDPDISSNGVMDDWFKEKAIDLYDYDIPAGQWVKVTKIVNLARPAGMASGDECYLSVGVAATNALPEGVSSYTVYLDDVSIKEYVPVPGVQSFEEGASKLFAAKASTTTISTDRAHSGVSAVKMVIDKDYGSSETNRVVYEEDGVPVQFAFGKEYEVSFWIYSEQTFRGKPRLVFDPDISSNDVMDDWFRDKGIDLYDYDIPAGQWVQVQKTLTLERPAGITSGDVCYLSVGVAPTNALPEGVSSYTVYLDDASIRCLSVPEEPTPDIPNYKMNPITSVYQYVGGAGDKSSLQAEAGSAVYTHTDGTLRTAFRVAATYVTDKADCSTVVLDGVSYAIEERGIILGKTGDTLTVDSPLKVSSTAKYDKYWKYDEETGTVSYSVLVKNVSEDMLYTNYIARSYVKITVGGEVVVIYSDVSTTITPYRIYDAAKDILIAQGKEAPAWFPIKEKVDDGYIDVNPNDFL